MPTPGSSALVTYEGRTLVQADGSVAMGFPGVTTFLRFEGREVRLTASASARQFLDVAEDGHFGEPIELLPGSQTYVLFRNDQPGPHTLTIVRRNESWQGTYAFQAFEVEGGRLLEPPALSLRKLLFIGDSVTCGEMTAFVPGRAMNDPINSNARTSYGMLVAAQLGARCQLVSYGGRGVLRDWQGNRAVANAPEFYKRTLPDDPTTRWDPHAYVPDAVGIQLGTNDFSSGIPDEAEFVTAYVELVRKVRRDAPDALIFLMESPILSDSELGPRRTVLRVYLEHVLARLGDKRAILVPIPHYPGVPGNGHPTGAEHGEMAALLNPRLRSELRW